MYDKEKTGYIKEEDFIDFFHEIVSWKHQQNTAWDMLKI